MSQGCPYDPDGSGTQVTGNISTEDGRSENDIKRHKPEDHIESNIMSDRHYSMEQRQGQLQNHCYPDLIPLICGYIAEY